MKLKVATLLHTRDLLLRSWADELFNMLAEKRGQLFILDFSEIDFVSRSFAHEYLTQKKVFNVPIEEKNMKSNVEQMFRIAAQLPNKKDIAVSGVIVVQNL
ncbi:MAG: hypothetical protein ACYDAO_09825 [Thermoplasmataceae archaeon]